MLSQILLANNILEILGILPNISAYPIVGKSLTIYKLLQRAKLRTDSI